MSKFQLDFSIYSSKDRLKAIRDIPLETLSKTELETVSNYVLYGKDEDGTSVVDRKEVFIKTKYNSYNKNKCVSLDEMMENPAFDEAELSRDKTIYKKVKPKIDREKVKDIPGMRELWDSIDKLQRTYDENTGKKTKTDETPTLSSKQLYHLRHQLIELRTEQYQLMDTQFPTTLGKKNKAQFFPSAVDAQGNYPILPRGVMRKENDEVFMFPYLTPRGADPFADIGIYTEEDINEWLNEGKVFFDFRNKEHLYQLIQFYTDLKFSVEKMPDSILNNLLWTLDFYIEKAKLSEQQRFIVEQKKMRYLNKDIARHLKQELGISHQENYISTIWNKSVGLIVDAVELNYDEFLCRNYNKAWKVCTRCGEILLRDERNFVRKRKALDGLTSRCKKCDKELRQG